MCEGSNEENLHELLQQSQHFTSYIASDMYNIFRSYLGTFHGNENG